MIIVEYSQHLQDQWQKGNCHRSVLCGRLDLIDGPQPVSSSHGPLWPNTQAQADSAVNRYADLGIYPDTSSTARSILKLVPAAIVKVAHARGLRVSGHVPSGMTARQFVEEGADEIQHINFIMLNFLASKVQDTHARTLHGSRRECREIDLQSKPVNDFIRLLVNHHTTVDVTLATFEGMFTASPGSLARPGQC